MIHEPRTRRFTTDEYHWMGRVGILTEDDRVELIDGEIIELPPIGDRHSASCSKLNRFISGALGDTAIVRIQDPIKLGPHSEPEPDVAVVRARDDFYATGHPVPSDLLLLVEVADTSAGYDRGTKLPLYASVGIPEVWLVDLQGQRVEMHRDPSPEGYRAVEVRASGQRVSALLLSQIDLAVDDILA
jgi:Uma2 family endonuclease